MRISPQAHMGGRDIDAFLAAAEADCHRNGIRLTAIRREVLRLVLSHDRPVGAYDILEKLRVIRHNAAPPTVYRALEFLMARGFIHRLERLAAFVACSHVLNAHECGAPRHKVQFLICRQCHVVKEISGSAVEAAIAQIAAAEGFSPQHTIVEIEGLCQRCALECTVEP